MPALDIENPGVSAVASLGSLLSELLDEAAIAKATTTIEPTLNKSNFKDISGRVLACVSGGSPAEKNGDDYGPREQAKAKQFAIIETAARDLFGKLIVGGE
jgi:THO complex subunit 1